MRILVTGAGGQLGRELRRVRAPAGLERIALAREHLDVTDSVAVERALDRHRPGLVINAAAFTGVDAAEDDPRARAVNHEAVGGLARDCARREIALFHVSTDYVFDGSADRPYTEDDPVAPVNAYGRGKLDGERALRAAGPNHVILRTSWVFSSTGHNFVRSILRAARERDELRVVADQRGCPTPAAGLAAALLALAGRLREGGELAWGTYHYCGAPPASWYAFAEAIVAAAGRRTALAVRRMTPIATTDWPTPAPRPAYSVLDCGRARSALGLEPPRWQPALEAVLDELCRD